jgi:hypothetical protein
MWKKLIYRFNYDLVMKKYIQPETGAGEFVMGQVLNVIEGAYPDYNLKPLMAQVCHVARGSCESPDFGFERYDLGDEVHLDIMTYPGACGSMRLSWDVFSGRERTEHGNKHIYDPDMTDKAVRDLVRDKGEQHAHIFV